MRHALTLAVWTAMLLFLPRSGATLAAPCDDRKDVIPAARAGDHVGERGTFAMTVKSTHDGTHRRTYFLDSEEDHHVDSNLAVLISYDHAEPFRKAGIKDPAAYYRGKTIRVTGKVIAEEEQVRIRVTEPGQIEVVKAAKP